MVDTTVAIFQIEMGRKQRFSGALVESVTSSAGLQRQLSTIGMNYGKLRSNLDVQKAGKMAFLGN